MVSSRAWEKRSQRTGWKCSTWRPLLSELFRRKRRAPLFLQAEARGRRNASEHQLAISRLQRLLHHCGGIELGDDLQAQDGLCQASAEQRRRQLQTLCCSCKSEAYAAIRQGQFPFPSIRSGWNGRPVNQKPLLRSMAPQQPGCIRPWPGC